MRTPIAVGIDISKHQGNVNMKMVRENGLGIDGGINHVIMRAGYGNNNTDQQFMKNAEAAVNLGINAGIYWFSYALNASMAEEEARFAIRHAGKYWTKCMIAYDAEYDTRVRAAKAGVNLDKRALTEMAVRFLGIVNDAGYYPCLYTNNDYTKNFFDVPLIKQHIPNLYIWYARYGKEDDNIYTLPVDMWQYSSKGRVNGISGNVDMNYIYKEYNPDFKDTPVSIPQHTSAQNGDNLYIRSFQEAFNLDLSSEFLPFSSALLVIDGIDGPKTQNARRKILLRKDCKYLHLTKFLQRCLQDRGYYHGEIDGIYGDKTAGAVRQYQEDNNLEVDGVAGYETITSLFYI